MEKQANNKLMQRLIAVVLVLASFVVFISCNKKKTVQGIIAGENYGFNEGMFVYYTVQVVSGITDAEMKEHNYDEKLDLDKQYYEDGLTWYDMIMQRTTDRIRTLLIYCEAAFDEGIVADSEINGLVESGLTQLRISGVTAGNLSVNEYLRRLYNFDIVEEDIRKIYTYEAIATKYTTVLYDRYLSEISQTDIANKVESLPESEKDTSFTRTFGHILLKNADYDYNDETMLEKANEIADEFINGEITKDRFNELAKKKSGDSNVFFENISKGEMIEAIDKWLYADAREVGDVGVEASTLGVHVLFYESEGKKKCDLIALDALMTEKFDIWFKLAEDEQYVKVDKKAVGKINFGK